MRYFNLLFVLLCYSSHAQQKKILDNDIEKQPSMALLNYLAEMAEVDGQLIGPQDMIDKNCLSKVKDEELNKENKDDATKKSQQSDISKDKVEHSGRNNTEQKECQRDD